jgi:hypothetical protein
MMPKYRTTLVIVHEAPNWPMARRLARAMVEASALDLHQYGESTLLDASETSLGPDDLAGTHVRIAGSRPAAAACPYGCAGPNHVHDDCPLHGAARSEAR